MRLWLDDIRPAPEGYIWCKSVNDAKQLIRSKEYAASVYDDEARYYVSINNMPEAVRFTRLADLCYIELIDIDHDAGEYADRGGDYIKLLDWLEETGHNYPIRIHSQNVVGVENMRRIIQRNGWKEVF